MVTALCAAVLRCGVRSWAVAALANFMLLWRRACTVTCTACTQGRALLLAHIARIRFAHHIPQCLPTSLSGMHRLRHSWSSYVCSRSA